MKVKIVNVSHDPAKGTVEVTCEIKHSPVTVQEALATLQAKADKKAYMAGLAKAKYSSIIDSLDLLGEVEV